MYCTDKNEFHNFKPRFNTIEEICPETRDKGILFWKEDGAAPC